jgi:hypothetical protein
MAILATLLVAGCAPQLRIVDSFCDLSEPILFGSEAVISELLTNDAPLLRSIVQHNMRYDRLCTA